MLALPTCNSCIFYHLLHCITIKQVVSLPRNIEIIWDGVKKVEMKVPDSEKGSLCGICGNFDGVVDGNDMQMGQNTLSFNKCPGKALSADSWGKNVSYQIFSNFLGQNAR